MYNLRQNSVSPIDRFIPKRAGSNVDISKHFLQEDDTIRPSETSKPLENAKINRAYEKWRKKKFQSSLWIAMINPKSPKVLNFFENSGQRRLVSCDYYSRKVWPSFPRKKPFMRTPIMTLDLPDIEDDLSHNIVDWGSNDCLATVFGNEVYYWQVGHKNPRLYTNTGGRVQYCVKWSYSGTFFSMAMNRSSIGVWENGKLSETFCFCYFYTRTECVVNCMQWTKNNTLIAGCGEGRVSVYNKNLVLLKTIPGAHNGGVVYMTISCKETYLATTGLDGRVAIWKWPTCEFLWSIELPESTKAIAWHPWREPLFAIGASASVSFLHIWKVSNFTLVGRQIISSQISFVNGLAWNAVSGELVVSYSIKSGGKLSNWITIMSDLNVEVDSIDWQTSSVLYLLWNFNGTKLAIADVQEGLCIWEFFEKPKMTKLSRKLRREKDLKNVERLSLGYCIR